MAIYWKIASLPSLIFSATNISFTGNTMVETHAGRGPVSESSSRSSIHMLCALRQLTESL